MATKTKKKIDLNHYARASALIYAEALLDGCRRTKIDPIEALVDTDDFPRLLKIPGIEFAIGWLHGCAEAHAVTVDALWEQVIAGATRGLKQRDAELRGAA